MASRASTWLASGRRPARRGNRLSDCCSSIPWRAWPSAASSGVSGALSGSLVDCGGDFIRPLSQNMGSDNSALIVIVRKAEPGIELHA
jgi:hypothetical protein